MDSIIIVLQVGLAIVLAVAGYGKLRDMDGSRQAVRDFGVPRRLADPMGTALPFAELVIAALLLPGATTRWAALAAGLLFLVFVAAIGYNLRQGRQPDCHCFGQIHSEPAGWPTIVRNAALTVIAAIVVVNGGVGLVAWLEALSDVGQLGLVLTLGILAIGAAQSWFLRQLVLQNRELLERIGSLSSLEATPAPAETPLTPVRTAPEFDLPALDGSRMSLSALLARRKPVMLVFADPNCGPCRALVPDIAEWQRRFSDDLTVAVVSKGTPEANEEKFGSQGITDIALQEEWETYEAYGVRGTPSGVLVQPNGEVKEAFAPGRDRIRELVARVVSGYEATPSPDGQALDPGGDDPNDLMRYLKPAEAPEVGTPGSRLPLPAIDGGYVSLDDYRGDETAVLFWNANCGFCQRMLPELKEWEEEAGELTNRLLVISMGTPEENREMGLRSKVVLDDGFTTAKAFGATGTPSAILLDREGRVASPLAVGADAVLDLLYEKSDQVPEPV